MCRQFSLHCVISACATKKKNIQTVKVSLLTCLKIRGHELPASALSLIFPLHRDRSAATWSAVIRRVIVRSDCDFFTMFRCAALSQWTFTDLYRICRSAGLSEISPALKLCYTNVLDTYFSWLGAHRMGVGTRVDTGLQNIYHRATSISAYWHYKYWYALHLIFHLFLSKTTHTHRHTHGRAVLQAEWASIMWSPRCINSSSRRRLSHLITLNQTNVDERWRERGEGVGRRWRGGLEGSARDELTVNV